MAFRLMQQIVDHLEHRFPPDTLIYSMTTNGALLDRYAEFLVEKKFELLISLDGNRENSAYRVFKNGKPTFDTAMASGGLSTTSSTSCAARASGRCGRRRFDVITPRVQGLQVLLPTGPRHLFEQQSASTVHGSPSFPSRQASAAVESVPMSTTS
jgi:hypothetical protein